MFERLLDPLGSQCIVEILCLCVCVSVCVRVAFIAVHQTWAKYYQLLGLH